MKKVKNLKAENLRDFRATCSDAKIVETGKALYKFCYMAVKQTLVYWKKTGRISTRNGFNNKGL